MNARHRSGLTITVAAILMMLFILSSCSTSYPASPTYNATIQEGQSAAQEAIKGGASALTIALVDGNHIIWSQIFGLADREAGQAPTETTMFGIGSVSKVFAAVAVMKLVDRGIVGLDTPLITYLPSFRMASPGYEKITVRMLLNHSSGFPGTDYRNCETSSPYPGYLNQVIQSLSMERLKAPPGYMNVYCNDGFTLTEALVQATTGKSYVQFVQDEILTPLGMVNSRYATDAFPDGSYVKAYVSGVAQPQNFMNAFASGGLYTTAKDMGRLAMMFLGDGKVGDTRILSSASVAQMAVDQTIGTFNPVHSNSTAYGLGWDSVMQPGLKAVGFDGWSKGGDSTGYHAAIVVSPTAQLGVVVIGASSFGSGLAISMAERVLLRALAESGRIATFPAPLPSIVPPLATVPDGLLAAIAGYYAEGPFVMQLQPQPDGSLLFDSPLKYRNDGWFASDQNPLQAYKIIDAVGKQYFVKRAPGGYGHYLDQSVEGQRVRGTGGNLSAAWSARLSSIWLVVNENSDSIVWSTMNPRLRLATLPELSGLILFRFPYDGQYYVVDPSASDLIATNMLIIPQLNGRDLDDFNIALRNGVEWIRFGSYMHQPLSSVIVMPRNATSKVTIGPEGYAEWRAIATDVSPVRINISAIGAWRIYDPSFTNLANGKGNGVASLPAGSGLGYLLLFGDPGQTITVTVQ